MSDSPSIRHRTNRADVMISSTSLDLPDHRKAVMDAIWRVKMYPLAMESGSAVPDSDAIKFSLDMVEEAEVYVGIFGYRYGHVPVDSTRNPDEVSVTELEYRRAVERGIPILIYIMSKKHTVLAEHVETDPVKLGKLNKLKDEFKGQRIIAEFDSAEDLKSKVLQSLYEFAINGIVNVAADAPPVNTDPAAVTIPAPPELYSVPPYILTNKFVGRVDELNQLDAWAKSSDPLLVIEAIGGMGKSALTWEWVNNTERARKAIPNLKGIFWWSFYERGATMEAFIRHALAYITRRNPDSDELKKMRYEERAGRLLHELTNTPYLLVLDGLERVLLAYHRWDAAQMRDDSLDDTLTNDPQNYRACIDPRDSDLLQRLTVSKQGKLLISSRLMPRALEDARNPLPGVQHIKLTGLNPEDAYHLMQERGVKTADRTTLNAFMNSIGRHSLLLKMIAGRIQNFRPAPGNFDRWYAEQGRELHLSDMDIKQKRTHILKYALEGLEPEKRKLLSQISAFNDAVSYDTLSVFNPYLPPKPDEVNEPRKNPFLRDKVDAKYNEQKAAYDAYLTALNDRLKSTEYRAGVATFDMALTELEERGLLQWDRQQDSYDLHPVVRGYSFDLLEQDDKVQAFDRIHDYFQSRPKADKEKVLELQDLKNTIEIYRALLGAGKLDLAASFFNDNVAEIMTFNIAAYHKAFEFMAPFFADGLDNLPQSISSDNTQSSITAYYLMVLFHLGRTDEARILRKTFLKWAIDKKDPQFVLFMLSNNIFFYNRDDSLSERKMRCELALNLAKVSDVESYVPVDWIDINCDIGNWQVVEEAYSAFIAQEFSDDFWIADGEYFYALALFRQGLNSALSLDKSESAAESEHHALRIRSIHNLRGEIALKAGQLDEAADCFQTAITLAQKAGVSTNTYRGGLARTRVAQGRNDEARRLVKEGVDDIDAGEVFLKLGDIVQAKEYAIKAYEWAWGDGPPYSWWWELERSKKVLDALGESYPDLPPFDPTKVEPIPYEAEILAFIEELKEKKAAKEAEEAAKKAVGDDDFDFDDDKD